MSNQHNDLWNRRKFLTTAALAGTGALLGLRPEATVADPPPETTRITVGHNTEALCLSPQYVAQELLRNEGLTDVRYAKVAGGERLAKALVSGAADMSMHFAATLIPFIDAGEPIIILAGGHVGCYELFATDRVRSIRDLKGKTVAVAQRTSTTGALLDIILAHVGLDPKKDVNWVAHPQDEQIRLLADRKIDAFLAFPPTAQELRAKKIGHVIFNSMMDKPWSQYFCCVVAGNRDFVRKNPLATKRALLAILKGADLCAREPERAARLLVDKGFTKNYDYALQTMKEMNYGQWREFDPEDTVRFFSLRLHEIGAIKSSPQKIIAQGTD